MSFACEIGKAPAVKDIGRIKDRWNVCLYGSESLGIPRKLWLIDKA